MPCTSRSPKFAIAAGLSFGGPLSRGNDDREWNGQRDMFILVLPYVSRLGLLFVSAFPYLAACSLLHTFLYTFSILDLEALRISLSLLLPVGFLIPSCT